MHPKSPQYLVNKLNIKFNNYLLLNRALTHRSYLNEHPNEIEDNERLEFLGDAVLDFLVADWLYNQYPEMPEGDLTQIRSALVQTPQLADFARQIGLGDVMRLGLGEVRAGGRLRSSLLCDTFEALVGAIYLDQGLKGVNKLVVPLLEKAIQEILINHKNEDPKSQLQEWAQSLGYPPPKYKLIKTTGPDHLKQFEVDVQVHKKKYGAGQGSSKQQAEKMAAIEALKKIGLSE
jgi:ribonuclease-3